MNLINNTIHSIEFNMGSLNKKCFEILQNEKHDLCERLKND